MTSDANAFASALAAARMGWMTGQLAEVTLPEFEAFDAKEVQLRLLALDAQFRTLTGAPVLTPKAAVAPAMPAIPRKAVPDDARGWFQRIWREEQQQAKVKLLRFLDQRGYIAHPFDFMPQTQWDGLPDAYAPLLEWSRRAAAGVSEMDEDNTYRAYSGAETREYFADLHHRDRQEATTWLEAELAQGNAQQRVRLLTDVATYLDDQDEPLLQRLVQEDRSGKVKALAVQILRRNGCKTERPEDLSALDYIEQSKSGLLRRKARISTVAKINQTRVNLLSALLAQISLPDLAAHFGLSSPEFLEAWHWDGAHQDINIALQRCVLETGQDEDCLALFRKFAQAPGVLSSLTYEHLERFGSDTREIVKSIFIEGLSKNEKALWQLVDVLSDWRLLPLNAVQSETLWARAQKHTDLKPKASQEGLDFGIYVGAFLDFAFCLKGSQAQAALDLLAEVGVHAADPMLAPLHLNVALPEISQEGT